MSIIFEEYGDAKSLYSECGLMWNQTLTNDPTYFEKKMVSQCHITITTTLSVPTTTTSIMTSTTTLTVSNGCSLGKFCTRAGWCENFTSLNELNSTLLGINSSCEHYFNLESDLISNVILLKANKYKGPLNDRFNYELFLTHVFPNMSDNTINIAFLGFHGLDFNFSSVYKSHRLIDPKQLGFYFVFPEFDFYLNGEKVEMSSPCNESESVKISNYGIFSAASSLTLNFEYKSPDSSFKNWCPFLFKNASLNTILTIGKPLKFNQGTVAQSDNNNIMSVEFDYFVVEYLNNEILSSQTYSNVKNFFIRGSIKNVQMDVFKELKGVETIILYIYNLKGFIHGNGIKWMNFINYNMTAANSSLLEIKCDQQCLKKLRSMIVSVEIYNPFEQTSNWPVEYYPNAQPYTFPDEDFCIFANYPHEKGILTIIEYDLPNCTCTITWLYKNPVLLTNYSHVNVGYPDYIFGNACLLLIQNLDQYERAFNECNFPEKIKKCNLNSANLNQSFVDYKDMYFYFYGIQSNLKQTQQILNTYFSKWVLFLGLLANFFTSIVIINSRYKANRYKNKKNNPLEGINDLFFTYMLINALINLVYCLMMFFYQIFPCEPTPVGRMSQIDNCLITNICISTTESILKLMANVTYLQMSLNRYLLIGKDHAKWLKSIAKANIALVLFISLICSILLSYVVIDQHNFTDFLFNSKIFLLSNLKPSDYYYSHDYTTFPLLKKFSKNQSSFSVLT
jgi:hypothetical protein